MMKRHEDVQNVLNALDLEELRLIREKRDARKIAEGGKERKRQRELDVGEDVEVKEQMLWGKGLHAEWLIVSHDFQAD